MLSCNVAEPSELSTCLSLVRMVGATVENKTNIIIYTNILLYEQNRNKGFISHFR